MLFISTLSFSQTYVEIEGYQKHKIKVSDSVMEKAVKDFYGMVYVSRIDYETKLTELKEVRTMEANRSQLHYYKDGVIYINSYADKFPFTKQVIILHELGLFYGAQATSGSSLDVMNEHFYLTEKFERNYKYRKQYNIDLKKLIAELQERIPLKTK